MLEGAAATNIPYGMPIPQSIYDGGTSTTDSVVPLTKFRDIYYGPELPPRKERYITQQSTLAPPNVCDYSDTYVRMNPARASVPEFSSRPQYEVSTVAKAVDNEKLYDEIPGEHLTTFSEEQKAGDDNQYVSIPSSSEVTSKPQDADEEETSDPNGSENAYVMD